MTTCSFLYTNLLILLLAFASPHEEGELYDAGRSTIINLNPMNFNTQITNNRNKNVISFIHFYSPDDTKSPELKNVIVELDKEYSGMFKLAGLNCKKYVDLCAKEGVTTFPTFKVYPPLPVPIMQYDGKITGKHILSYLSGFVGNKVNELNNNNFDDFISDRPNIPKIILFSNKKNIPLIIKRLSLNFEVSYFHI